MQKTNRNQHQPYPQYNLSKHLLKHQYEMLQFLCFTSYDIILQSFQLKHASYISSSKRGYPVQQFNKQEQIQRHFKMISQKLHIRLMRDDIVLDKLLDRLQILWHNRNVPMFHRYYFQKYIYSTFVKNVQELIEIEQKLVKEEKHLFYHIFKTINARQACLRQLKRHVSELTSEDVYEYLHIARQRFFNQKKKNEHFKLLQKGYRLKSTQFQTSQPIQQAKISKCKLQFFSDNFNHLTKLTLYCIDQIIKWKEYIFGLTHDAKKKRQRVQYYYIQENYFLKILSDTGFLKVSVLQKFYKFSPKNDPFFLWPLLAFEKSETKQLENELLKSIFMPLQQQLPQILSKMEILSDQYKWNIRSRKNYDITVLKKPTQIQAQKKKLDGQEKQPLSNLVLKKIQDSPPKRSSSLKTFRIREQTKQKKNMQSSSKDKILIEFKTSPKKKANCLPGGILKTFKETQISPLKNSVILQRNKVNPLMQNQVSDDLLKSLKQQVIRKIKMDYQISGVTKSTNHNKDEALQMYINTKINDAIKDIFPYQPQKQLKPPIELTSFRIQQSKLSQQISLITKHTIQLYSQMQHSESQLIKKIQQSPYVYFIKATVGDQYLATIIVALDRQVQQYKTLRTLYIGFNDLSQLEMLIIQTTKFIEKYQNAFEMHFPFFQPTTNQAIKQLLFTLQQNLTASINQDRLPCIVAQKQIYSNIAQIRFIFKRQNKNTNYYPNRYPTSMHFKVSLIHSQKKLFLQRSKIDRQYSKKISYDFLLCDIMRKIYTSEIMNMLKQKTLTQIRFKQIINVMIELDKGQQKILGQRNTTRFIESQSISELNKQLSKRKQQYPYLQLSDTVKTGNKVHSVSLSGVFSLHYNVTKSVVGKNSQIYYKITIKQQIPIYCFKQTLFYKFNLKDEKIVDQSNKNKSSSMQKHLILFTAEQYLKLNYSDLSTYLIQAIVKNSQQQRKILVNQLWFPMLRYPQQYQQREELFLTTHRVEDLKQLKQELFVGQFFEWFCDMRLQNGIKYKDFDQKQKQGLVILKKPLGIAVVAQDKDKIIILYARVFVNK